ncbi:MAG: hypothetical protein HW386_2326, partial [Gammaproteobacteria bacterium]|nr:hypothetical protein [Gammaproteobacteria bacterium]
PLPSKPADSLGGSINFVRKNAFEKAGAEFTYGVALVANNLTLMQSDQGCVIGVPGSCKGHSNSITLTPAKSCGS